MESQPFNYWNYIAASYQPSTYNLTPDVSEVPSLSGSPASMINDQFPPPPQQTYYPQIADEQIFLGPYPTAISPSEFNSDHESPQCSPHPAPPMEVSAQSATPADRTHATSGRRRAQNRAAQRAFRERKEKHARDLENQLSAMHDKYNKLEASHSELNIAYDKLRRTLELLTNADEDGSKQGSRRSGNGETLRKLLDILHGEFKASVKVKKEDMEV